MKCDILCRELTSVGIEAYILPKNFLVFKGMLLVENLGLQIISGVKSRVFTIIISLRMIMMCIYFLSFLL